MIATRELTPPLPPTAPFRRRGDDNESKNSSNHAPTSTAATAGRQRGDSYSEVTPTAAAVVAHPLISFPYFPEGGGSANGPGIDMGGFFFEKRKCPRKWLTSATPQTIRAGSILARVQATTSLSSSIRSMRSTRILASFLAIIPVRLISLALNPHIHSNQCFHRSYPRPRLVLWLLDRLATHLRLLIPFLRMEALFFL